MTGFAEMFETQRPVFFYWVPVALGTGIGAYFAAMEEPPVWLGAACLLASIIGLVGAWRMPMLRIGVWVLVLASLGFTLATWRAQSVAAPVLEYRYYGPVEGRIAGISRSYGNALRVTLDRVRLKDSEVWETPATVRISLLSGSPYMALEPGARLMITANLSPPSAPAEPGGFDFRRLAWFDRLGAVGYARTAPLPVETEREGGVVMWLFGKRTMIAKGIREAIPGAKGAFAAAILTGDRSEIDPNRLEDLRASNLAHLLAISGLHMGLLTGFVLLMTRYALLAVPGIGVRWHVKKVAAVAALLAGAAYLALSGASVATQRAFIMAAVIFGAILVDRQALTLRSVALAAIIVLVIRPESLTEAGFQMSFAATTGLVVGFQALRQTRIWSAMRSGRWQLVRPVVMLVFSSALAGAATAPFSAFHFNQIAQFGLLANLLAVPMMGMVVMPAAVAAALLSFVGLDWLALTVMGWGIAWILGVAQFVAGLEGSVQHVPSGGPWVLPLLSFGALLLLLPKGRIAAIGAPVVVAALGLWASHERPEVLISGDGRVLGLRTDAGRDISHEKGNGFAVRSWLENDGDGATQFEANARAGLFGVGSQVKAELQEMTLVQLRGKRQDPVGACKKDVLLIATDVWDKPAGACLFYGVKELRQSGALAVYARENGLEIIGAKAAAGRRLWTD